MRLDTYVKTALMTSKKEAKSLIRKGRIFVDDAVCKKGDRQIDDNQKVRFEDQLLVARRNHYIMINKPAGYVCSNDDPLSPTFLDLLPEEFRDLKGLHTVGRLDKDTTGLLLVTDDGQFTHDMISPKKEKSKVYKVTLKHDADPSSFDPLKEGIFLRGEEKRTRAASVETLNERVILLAISEGKYHQVKRMIAACGNRVEALQRVRIGSLELPSELEEGQWRYLTCEEVQALSKGEQ